MGPVGDMGPRGCWIFAGIMVFIGIGCAVYMGAKGIHWLINHVHIS